MAGEEQPRDVELTHGLLEGGSSFITPPPSAGPSFITPPPSAGLSCGIPDLNLATEYGEASRGDLQHPSAKSSEIPRIKSVDISQKTSSVLVTNEKMIPSIPGTLRKSFVAAKGTEPSPFQRMPYVQTTGDGPTGKKITGVLYQHTQPGEVSILCICHGMFLSPAEFVKHAGGTETAQPIRKIAVVHY